MTVRRLRVYFSLLLYFFLPLSFHLTYIGYLHARDDATPAQPPYCGTRTMYTVYRNYTVRQDIICARAPIPMYTPTDRLRITICRRYNNTNTT